MIAHVQNSVRNFFRPRHLRRPAEHSLAELLGRRPVNLDTPELQRFLAGKRVLVTGAGGSIGSEICRQIMKFCPGRLVLIDRAENSLFEIDRELREQWVGSDVAACIADICDGSRIAHVFAAEAPQVIFHCAAHKHVPMMEHNPGEAVKNNVFGTKVVADAALACGAGAFVLVSTDKAVNPTSVMGATKRVAELYVQSLNESGVGVRVSGFGEEKGGRLHIPETRNPKPETRFLAVRFGNVLGSSGSVVPIFNRQIDAGGPVTVTHPEMTRYFMTIAEASQLVMQAGAIGRGGEIFVLDMGQPVRILDLATEMIRRRGLKPGDDIEVKFTGIRPGEKLHEELAGDTDRIRPTSHEKIRVWELPRPGQQQIRRMLELLREAIATESSCDRVLFALQQAVPEYTSTARPDDTPAMPANPPLQLIPSASAAA
jgi:FlaA1/EpsC-like NDP-sugar epimerase